MDEARVRAWWWHRQGLDGSLSGKTPAKVLEQSGWARSVAGAGPYLTLYSRAGTSREAADQSVAKLEIHELPSARGCTYVVPAGDFALALRVGQEFGAADMNVAYNLGVTEKEIDNLCAAVLKALAKGPMDPDKIREGTGNASRSLGEAGKKKGVTTTLPLALGRLQNLGEIRRIPVNGRLDQQRYRYTLWRPNPLLRLELSIEEASFELARRFFRWIGPATFTEFRWFSGLGVKATKAAVQALKLVPLVEGDERWLFPEDRDAFLSFKIPTKPQYSLVSSLDAMFALRRNVKGLLDPKDVNRQVFDESGMKAAGALSDLPNHAIVDRGRLVGLWEYDPEMGQIAWATFGIKDKALDEAVKRTQQFVGEQLGDARSFSLDSPKSRVPRIQALRKLRT